MDVPLLLLLEETNHLSVQKGRRFQVSFLVAVAKLYASKQGICWAVANPSSPEENLSLSCFDEIVSADLLRPIRPSILSRQLLLRIDRCFCPIALK